MNFNLGRFFYLAASFVIGTFFFLIGIFSIIFPWSPLLQSLSIQFLLEKNLVLLLFGLGFALIGLSIVINTIMKSGRRYVNIHTGNLDITLDENVIRYYLENYWKEQYPQNPILFELNFKKKSLQIIADLPFLPLQDQKTFLEKIKHDFRDLFGRLLGYPYDVHLIASFQNTPQLPM